MKVRGPSTWPLFGRSFTFSKCFQTFDLLPSAFTLLVNIAIPKNHPYKWRPNVPHALVSYAHVQKGVWLDASKAALRASNINKPLNLPKVRTFIPALMEMASHSEEMSCCVRGYHIHTKIYGQQ